jgi:hypothetical protein
LAEWVGGDAGLVDGTEVEACVALAADVEGVIDCFAVVISVV